MMTFRVFFLFVVVLVALPSVAQLNIPFEKYTLPNGLEVILHEDHTIPVIAVNIWYHVGASREKAGKTGFAHLFEHLMFEGSEHVKDGLYDQIVEGSGGSNNASTGFDRTNYFLAVPKNYVEPALWLESDRMGFLLPGITQDRLDLQRDVVKNERREGLENQPYGMAYPKIFEALYPPGVPYHWLPIGSQEDLSAASLDDVKNFFRAYYSTHNASLCIGGDFETGAMKKLVEKYFTDIPAGPDVPRLQPIPRKMEEVKSILYEDRVQLPRLYMVWHSPSGFAPDDAAMDILSGLLTGGKNSRLYRTLVYEEQIAQDVSAAQGSSELSGYFEIVVTPKPGHDLTEMRRGIERAVDSIVAVPPTARELQRAKNGIRSGFIYRLETVTGKIDQLNAYNTLLGDPGKFNDDLRRYETVTPGDIQRVAQTYLKGRGHVMLSVVPEGKPELQAKP